MKMLKMHEIVNVLIAMALLNFTLSTCCPRQCRCDDRKIVYCNERNLLQVPYGIPPDTKVLLLQGNFLSNDPSMESKLRRLTLLQRLDMHDNKLTSFPSNLPSSLTYLSLRLNLIKFIGKNALRGLDNLKELHLDSNNITNRGLSPNALAAAVTLEDLAMSTNGLTSLPEGLPSSLKSIRLDHNKVNTVSASSLQPLTKLMILDLSYNEISSLDGLGVLKKLTTIDLSHNMLVNLPPSIPNNVTELLVSSNRIQYIYTSGGPDHGDLQDFSKLRKLDLSSNHLRSIEKGSFSALPSVLSMELHDNPWRCDCNLAYLKRWLTYTTSTLTSGEGGMTCATPYVFSGVTLNAIDAEALKCTHSSYELTVEKIQPDSVVIEYDASATQEPPYVTFSAMYGAMLCEDCTLRNDDNVAGEAKAHMWMEDYTIASLPSGVPTKITGLQPNTRYAICIVTSYQHPDQIGIEQCEDVRTSSADMTTSSPVAATDVQTWAMVGGIAGGVLLIGALVAGLVWRKRHRRRSLHSYIAAKPREHAISSIPYTARRGLPLIDANQEFDVTLMVRQDLARQSDSCYSDSHDESVSTTHTGTMTSRNSHVTNRHYDHETAQHNPQIASFLPDDKNNPATLNNNAGLLV